jgi:hypothetical protein
VLNALTKVGTKTSAVVPWPHCPWLFLPQL